jgi:hypothetical protein
MGFFSKHEPITEHHYHVIEFDKNTKLPELTGDLRESLKTLSLLPAFQYLMQRFRVKKAAMETTLREGFKLDEQQLRYCQAGIYWAGEIERDIHTLTQDQPQNRPAKVDELEEFRKVSRAITLVGQDETPQG